MKIENLIEDIKNDLQDMKEQLHQQLIFKYPSLDFSIDLPGLDDLSVVKNIALLITEKQVIHYLSVQIHTHNGNRLFENPSKIIIGNQLVLSDIQHPYQSIFVLLLRGIIRRKKKEMQLGKWQA
jgi:hypothetical protein